MLRALKWIGGFGVLLIVLCTAFIALFGWNWLREPIARLAMEKTGRELVIDGDLQIALDWPRVQVRSSDVKFANPRWAGQKYMLTADGVDFSLDLPELFDRHLAIDVLSLRRGSVFLEANAAGQKNWLLDLEQKDAGAHPEIGRLVLEQSHIAYDEPAQKTSIVAKVATADAADDGAAADLVVSAQGRWRGLPLTARASGGPVLALRDERQPYPFRIEATIGRTSAQAEGSVTGLGQLTALDARLALRGDSLAQLFPLLGIALPETRAYRSAGHLTHRAGMWRYEDFSARIGNSDLSGTLQVDTDKGSDKGSGKNGRRPYLHGDLVSERLEFADLGPVIGTRRGGEAPRAASAAESAQAAPHRVLPEVAFRAERWDSVDADVKFSAGTIIRARELPLDKLVTHIRMRDAKITLDPLEFGVAGGTLGGAITLDGQHDPIRAQIRLAARKIVLDKLFPTFRLNSANIGQISTELDLAGSGNSVAGMLATADGQVRLAVAGGEVSKLMMEMAGLHVLEIVTLKIAGDQRIKIRCGMADFRVRNGVMHAERLLFDTAISNVGGSGEIDFGQEKLDLTLLPKSKETSLIALRSPIYVRGNFARPVVEVDKGRIAARSVGALALGIANPLLALAPLVEPAPGADSDCGRPASVTPVAR